jgi:hypothetical protein
MTPKFFIVASRVSPAVNTETLIQELTEVCEGCTIVRASPREPVDSDFEGVNYVILIPSANSLRCAEFIDEDDITIDQIGIGKGLYEYAVKFAGGFRGIHWPNVVVYNYNEGLFQSVESVEDFGGQDWHHDFAILKLDCETLSLEELILTIPSEPEDSNKLPIPEELNKTSTSFEDDTSARASPYSPYLLIAAKK